MSSCTCKELGHQNWEMLGHRSSKFFSRGPFDHYPYGFPRSSVKIRCVLDHIIPKFAVSSSLNSVFSLGNVIAAAAAAATGSGSSHAAVTSALAHVAVTAVAIASGACLSTKVDFLWPRVEEQPDSLILDGVDVTGYLIFHDAKVQKAIAFARNAHQGQLRKTGDPYLSHCIHTGRILAALVPASEKRAIDTVVAGILHDVIDDTRETLHSIEEEFDADVAKLVAGVSRLSYINQLLRRHRRTNLSQGTLGPGEANNLRVMLLGMVDDPRVVLIKLADRLHNMRTIYALSSPKAQAVAQETLAVWCSLASRLGVWALKAELEDLCFAVLQDLLQAVLPFDVLLDRRKRSNFLHNFMKCSEAAKAKPKVVKDAGIALASLAVCEEALEKELFISTSYVPGMEVTMSSRLKSLYSIYCKMKRKDVGIRQIYDARALRVIVGDKKGTLQGAAVEGCYSLLNIIHRLWTPIDGEFDDYIVNPKDSGYQSLHTAVQGPDSAPLEVQIRTQRMHENAEYGLAAHWLYKEAENKVPSSNSLHDLRMNASYQSKGLEDDTSVEADEFRKYSSLKVGHPALRVEGSHLLAAVIIRVDKGGRELLVAVSFGLAASEAVADRKYSFQLKRWEAYARLFKKVSDQWWCEPGHGDWCTCLEKYTLCRDGMYHKQDQFQRLRPTFIQIIDLTPQEEAMYWMVVSAIFEGTQVTSVLSNTSYYEGSSSQASGSTPMEASINNKVRLLREMLQWEEHMRSEVGLRDTTHVTKPEHGPDSVVGEVVIVCWPNGEIMRMRTGSTAADAARRIGLEGKLVLVNGQLTLPHTELKDGDIVEVRV
ncbi:probable GTP diphosphokinase RSH2, chloroplastic isoform X3 [Telopea speciosissima]|uniref:probable GTP diphosphokinase RSH2, chloroplastic isoform X3 n=1 Tax=Telopea speciosissima TaxID=54955 RepID=UPI001CC504E3|nr:probable GTP diphosphokinase RSH2, chloroplastic isoform X3 [Telopea speciosissima]